MSQVKNFQAAQAGQDTIGQDLRFDTRETTCFMGDSAATFPNSSPAAMCSTKHTCSYCAMLCSSSVTICNVTVCTITTPVMSFHSSLS